LSLDNLPQTDQLILEEIRNGNPKVLEKIYDQYRTPFLAWAIQTYQSEEDTGLEIYQKAFTILYFNTKNGKLTTLTSSLKTYLFAIGKNLFREKFRDKHAQHLDLDSSQAQATLIDHLDTSILDQQDLAHQRELVRSLLSQIGDPCQKMLKLIFIQALPSPEVIKLMGYSDDRVLRKRKSLCLKQLREIWANKKLE
jgi:RNA polymerase sigma factor (sigma-70 family)